MSELNSKIESLLFISAKAMSVKQIAALMDKKEDEIKKACEEIVEHYQSSSGGVQIIKDNSKYQMVSSPDNAGVVQKFVKSETNTELSRPSLETLTIIAYRGPISKLDLDRIRGINCAMILRNLLVKGLIEAKEEKIDTYYSVTLDFVKFLGISDVGQLPDFEKLHKDDTLDKIIEDSKEQEMSNNK